MLCMLAAAAGRKGRGRRRGDDGWDALTFGRYLLTKFGNPEGRPWTVEEVRLYLQKVKEELEYGWHIYFLFRRVWVGFPFPVIFRLAWHMCS